MSPGRRMPSAAKRAMLAGAAALMLHAPAYARQAKANSNAVGQAPAKASSAAATNDGLAPDELYMEADRLTRDDKLKRTTAEGNVEIRYQGRTLRADRVVYDEGQEGHQGVIRAYGHVQIINPDKTVEYADQLVVDDKMNAGVAQGFAARLALNSKVASATMVRRSADLQELDRAIYTPCEICVGETKTKAPTWSIAADRVVQDKKRRLIFYRNARVRVLGVPVLYFPVFWHADPTANRVSGLLAPTIGASSRRGFSYQQPYLWTATPSMDIIVSPQINTKVNPFLNGEIHKRFYSGDVDLRFGYTYERDIDSNGNKFGDLTSRSYILGRGAFRIDDNWLLGFTAEHASDRAIFDKYDIGNVYQSRGPYVADDRRLISQLFAIRQDQYSYFSAAVMNVQGLRASLTVPGELENNRVIPVIAPLIEERYDPNVDIFGGRVHVLASAVALTRSQSPDNPALPGIDSRRLTTQADWRRSFILPIGLRVDPFVQVRADGYSLGDVPTGVGLAVTSSTVGRALATAGADISYPLFRRWGDSTVVLEPLLQLVASPNARQIVIGHDTTTGQPIFLDEDSASFEFDESNLFAANKFPGYDLYEDGVRMNVGGRASILWDDNRRAVLLFGRSFRTRPSTVFLPGSGLQNSSSDWIVAGEAQPFKNLSFFTRARFDGESFRIRRLEAGTNFHSTWVSGYLRYFQEEAETSGLAINTVTGLPTSTTAGQKQQNMDVGGELYIRKNWGLSFYGNHDFIQDAWVTRDMGVFYHDDCIRVDVIYRREDVVIGRLGPSNQVTVRLTLATLGGPIKLR
jgi:LPS-assembly protein